MSVFDSIKNMFNNKDDSHKHYKKGDYKSLVAESMNSLNELDGVKMDNSYVSPYEKRDFAHSVEIVDKDPKAELFSRHAKTNATKINNNIPKQTEDSFANMMKKTVNLPENKMVQNSLSKEDSFSTLMKSKVSNYKQTNDIKNLSNLDSQKELSNQRRFNSGLLPSLEGRNLEKYNYNKENMDSNLESFIPNGEEWKNFDEIYALTNVPKSNNEISIDKKLNEIYEDTFEKELIQTIEKEGFVVYKCVVKGNFNAEEKNAGISKIQIVLESQKIINKKSDEDNDIIKSDEANNKIKVENVDEVPKVEIKVDSKIKKITEYDVNAKDIDTLKKYLSKHYEIDKGIIEIHIR